MREKSPNVKFGTSTRQTMGKDNGLPGPGNYTVRDKNSGPSYKMGGKFGSKTNDLPGPGEYDPSIT